MDEGRPLIFWFGCALLCTFVIIALLAPVLAPYDPRLPSGPPFSMPTAEHRLGTNDLGQDVLSLLIHGVRGALLVAVSVALISTALSWMVGLAAGFLRPLEVPLMAVCDLLLALPSIPLYLLVATLIGPSRRNLILMLALLSWPGFARVVRSVVIQERSASHVEAARGLGATDARILYRHLLPSTLNVLPTKLILTVRFAVFAEATLAFLDLAQSGAVSWGTMLSHAFSDPLLFSRPVWPWLVLPPCLAIMVLIVATTWLSSGLDSSRGVGGWPVDRIAPDPPARRGRFTAGSRRPASST